MLALAIAFLTSLLITLLVIRYQHLHAHITADHDLDGVQKFHATPVPRVGGVGVYLGVLGGLLAKAWVDDPVEVVTNNPQICADRRIIRTH